MQRYPRRACSLAMILGAMLAGCSAPEPVGSPPQPVESRTVLCYRTLADVGCYGRPDAGRAACLVGVYQQPLDDPADPLFWLEPAAHGAEDTASR